MRKSADNVMLIAINPTQGIREFTIPEGGIVVGSDPANDLVIQDGTVSRRHASINRRRGLWEVVDLGSTNGVFINDRQVTAPTQISKGDEVRFGQARFVLWTVESHASYRQTGIKTLLAAAVLAILIAIVTAFISGTLAATRVHGSVVAREFVLVDQTGRARGVLTVFPESGEPNCRDCDGKAHFVVLGQRGQPPQIWPPTGPALDPAQLLSLIKLLRLLP